MGKSKGSIGQGMSKKHSGKAKAPPSPQVKPLWVMVKARTSFVEERFRVVAQSLLQEDKSLRGGEKRFFFVLIEGRPYDLVPTVPATVNAHALREVAQFRNREGHRPARLSPAEMAEKVSQNRERRLMYSSPEVVLHLQKMREVEEGEENPLVSRALREEEDLAKMFAWAKAD